MKKVIISILIFTLCACSLAACSNTASNTTEKDSTVSTTAQIETSTKEGELSTSQKIEIVSSLSMKQLGLKGKKEDYKFLLAGETFNIDGEEYFMVEADVQTSENEDGTISMQTSGQYLVTMDGKKILKKNLKTGETTEIK